MYDEASGKLRYLDPKTGVHVHMTRHSLIPLRRVSKSPMAANALVPGAFWLVRYLFGAVSSSHVVLLLLCLSRKSAFGRSSLLQNLFHVHANPSTMRDESHGMAIFDECPRHDNLHLNACTARLLMKHGGHLGDIFVATEGAEKWTMEQDEVGDIIFFHRETQVGHWCIIILQKAPTNCSRSINHP